MKKKELKCNDSFADTGKCTLRQIKDINELRSVQLGIMDSIHDFCLKNGIRYSLGGGTLIGAFRHRGYIPWDDDIDIYMLREDYERFISIYNDNDRKYKLLKPGDTSRYIYTFAKVIDTRTIMTEDEVEGYEIGVYVDVFPLDFVTDNMRMRKIVFGAKKLLYKIRRCKIQKNNPLKSYTAYLCYRYLPLSLSAIDWIISKYIHRRKPSGTICEMTDTNRPLKGCYSIDCMASTIDVTFEDRTYKAMAGYDEYLSNTYGNYMKLPPKEQQTQHKFKAYFK